MPRSLLVVALLLGLPGLLHARPPHKEALGRMFGPALAKKLDDCRTCHLPVKKGASEEDRPHNAYGKRLAALRSQLRKAGKPDGIEARIRATIDEDSDGDGVANGLELLAGRFPGEPDDRPTATEVADARKGLEVWRGRQRALLAWKPFEPVVRPAVPVKAGGRNPIDAFLAVEHEAAGLKARPEAPKEVLLRRASLDLNGIPPTRAELHAFLSDQRPDAYERAVDRLLASPRYGERWGRHWMDIWRYADWAGFGNEVRDSQKHIWHWRDWIVESLNADRGYDDMVGKMLAADEIDPLDTKELRATGFLVRNWYKFNRNVWLDRTVEHTAKAFLGVTINCARCHDHMYDPVSQKEYYAFRAIFETHGVRLDRVPGHANPDLFGLPRAYDANLTAPTYLFERGNEANPDKKQSIPPAVPAALGGKFDIKPVPLPPQAVAPDRREFVRIDTVKASQAAVTKANEVAIAARKKMEATRAVLGVGAGLAGLAQSERGRLRDALVLAEADLALATSKHDTLMAVLLVERLEEEGKAAKAEWEEAARKAVKAQRGQALAQARFGVAQLTMQRWTAKPPAKAALANKIKAAAQQVTKAEEALKQPITTAYTKRAMPTYPATSSGRRIALARWITDQRNPLTARVAVNHIWLRHFGQALVPTEFDFGKNGQPPAYPHLLDWLAAEFMERGWSMKDLHRLIVTSAAYRMDSGVDAEGLARDPDNRLFWRMNARRIEAEAVRDSVLAVSGLLQETMGGPDLDHLQALVQHRRSIYFRHAAEKQAEFLLLFDAASVNECYKRPESILPQQALALANSSLALSASRRLAGQLSATASAEADFVLLAFETVLGRPPTGQERELCRQFLARQAKMLADPARLTPFDGAPGAVAPAREPAQRAREGLVHVLLNHHEFVTIR